MNLSPGHSVLVLSLNLTQIVELFRPHCIKPAFETNVIFSDKEVKVAEIAVLKKTEETSTTDGNRSNKAIDEEIDDLVKFKDK